MIPHASYEVGRRFAFFLFLMRFVDVYPWWTSEINNYIPRPCEMQNVCVCVCSNLQFVLQERGQCWHNRLRIQERVSASAVVTAVLCCKCQASHCSEQADVHSQLWMSLLHVSPSTFSFSVPTTPLKRCHILKSLPSPSPDWLKSCLEL